MRPIVSIVGRPNVGKSTLFNRLAGKKMAIVDNQSGVTRDRIYEFSDWNGREFLVVDTGGYVQNSDDVFEKEIKTQVEFAVEEADVVVLVVDTQVGITDQDNTFTRYLRKTSKNVLVVANKTDNSLRQNDVFEFYSLGFEKVFPVSSINGSGTGELLDEIVSLFPEEQEDKDDEKEIPKFCVVGRPNVGKSTFINALLGVDRNIVSDIPGTTRDSIHSVYNKFDKEFVLIDTAGLRKKNKVFEDIEYYSVIRAIRSIDEADVCMLLVDANENIGAQDMNIVSLAQKRNKGLVVLVNKWDSIKKDTNLEKKYIASVREKLMPFTDVPVITISARDKTRIMKAVDSALAVYASMKRRIPTSELNRVMLSAIEAYHPPAVKGRFIKIKYVTQIKASYPLIAFYCNHPQLVKDPYRRYLENKLREHFNFSGVPIKLSFRKK